MGPHAPARAGRHGGGPNGEPSRFPNRQLVGCRPRVDARARGGRMRLRWATPSLIHNAHLATALKNQAILTWIPGRRASRPARLGGTLQVLALKIAGADHPRRAFAELMG